MAASVTQGCWRRRRAPFSERSVHENAAIQGGSGVRRLIHPFVFIERISEVTDVFEHERDFAAVAQKISSEGGVADVSGYTDYGRVWLEFLAEISKNPTV